MKALFLLPLLSILFVSCVQYQDMYQNKYASLGGDADVTFPGGGHLTHTHTASFQHFTQFAAAAVTGIAGAYAQASNNALNAANTATAAGVTKNAANNATKQAADKLAAASKDLKVTGGTQIQLAKIAKAPVPAAKAP